MKLRENIQQLFFFCFFSGALCDGDTFPPPLVEGAEGGTVTVGCSVQFVELGRKFFCRGKCEGDGVLVQTFGSQAQSGRFGLRYAQKSLLYVSIGRLRKADAGRYRCGVRRPLLPDSYKEFEVVVVEATTTSTQRPAAMSTLSEPDQQPAVFALVFVVCVTVGVLVLLAVALLHFYRKKDSDDRPLEEQSSKSPTAKTQSEQA